MSGFCSAHKHHEQGCKQCEIGEAELTENEVTLQDFISKLLENMVDLDPEYSKVVDRHFWSLV